MRDAGSAKSILTAGAQAIATSSWSVAEAQGYRDGEAIPIGREQIVGRITATVERPSPSISRVGTARTTANWPTTSRAFSIGSDRHQFEDRVVKGSGLYNIAAPRRHRHHSRDGGAEGQWSSSLMPARMCFSSTDEDAAGTVPEALDEPRPMRPLAHRASLFRG